MQQAAHVVDVFDPLAPLVKVGVGRLAIGQLKRSAPAPEKSPQAGAQRRTQLGLVKLAQSGLQGGGDAAQDR
jgi:hypothetical protein